MKCRIIWCGYVESTPYNAHFTVFEVLTSSYFLHTVGMLATILIIKSMKKILYNCMLAKMRATMKAHTPVELQSGSVLM